MTCVRSCMYVGDPGVVCCVAFSDVLERLAASYDSVSSGTGSSRRWPVGVFTTSEEAKLDGLPEHTRKGLERLLCADPTKRMSVGKALSTSLFSRHTTRPTHLHADHVEVDGDLNAGELKVGH